MSTAWLLPPPSATDQRTAAAPATELLPRFDRAAVLLANQFCVAAGPVAFGPFQAQVGSADLRAGRRNAYLLRGAGIRCRLWLDPLLEFDLLGEVDPDLVPRDIRAVVIAHGLAPLLDAISSVAGAALIVHQEADERAATGPRVSIRVARSGVDRVCGVELEVLDAVAWQGSSNAAMGARRRHVLDEWQSLPVPMHVAVGTAPILLGELRRLAPGDVIVIDSAASIGNSLPVEADVVGLPGYRLHLLIEQSTASVHHIERMPMNDPTPAAGIDATAIDALEVQVVFRIAQVTLPLHALALLQPGYVFELERALDRAEIQIVANGRPMGQGSLIAVGSRLGIRVESFAGPDAARHD
jgi:type III secretion system YscQ/HrcQ family protein